jgi:hypothetical protein
MPRRRDAPDNLRILFRHRPKHEKRTAASALIADIEKPISHFLHPTGRVSQAFCNCAFGWPRLSITITSPAAASRISADV